MTDIDTLCESTKLRLIACALGLQQCTKTAACIIPLPGTNNVIAIGPRDWIAKNVPGVEVMEPGCTDSLADRVFSLPCNWKGGPALHSAVLLGHTMACEQAYNLVMAESAQPVAWVKPDEIAGLLKAAGEDASARQYGRIYAKQYNSDMVPVHIASHLASQPQAAPVGEFAGYLDGIVPVVDWVKGSMPKVGDKLYLAAPMGREAQAEPVAWQWRHRLKGDKGWGAWSIISKSRYDRRGEYPESQFRELIVPAATVAQGEQADEVRDVAPVESERDPLYEKAVQVIRSFNRASLSLVQRTLLIGYNRTARLFEAMEAAGVVSALDENGHRTVLDWSSIKRAGDTGEHADGGAADE